MRRLILCLVAGTLAWSSYADDLASLLAKPLSAGSVALLVFSSSEPAVRERWAAALKDPRAEVRAAAARVINVAGASALLPDVVASLKQEGDSAAGEEEIRALAALGGKGANGDLEAAAKRLGPAAANAAAEAVARSQGTAALGELAAFRSVGLKSCEEFLSLATRDGKEGLSVAAVSALRDQDDGEWRDILAVARRPGAVLDPGIVIAGLSSESSPIQADTLWHLAVAKARGGVLSPRVVPVVEAAMDAGPAKDLAAGLPLELLRRLLGRKPVEQEDWLASLSQMGSRAPRAWDLVREPGLLAQLTRKEIESLGVATYHDPHALRQSHGPSADPPRSDDVVRTVDRYPPGFVASVLDAAGCEVRAGHGLAGAQISYGSDGRPRTVSMLENRPKDKAVGGPDGCLSAARILLGSSLVPRGRVARPQVPETVLVLLEPESLACLAENEPPDPATVPDESGGGASPAGANPFTAPHQVRRVQPNYPDVVTEAKIQGVVALEAQISPTGCIRKLELIRGIPVLNWEAMHAVSQWRYTPGLLHGKPVPVTLTVTVNFRLH